MSLRRRPAIITTPRSIPEVAKQLSPVGMCLLCGEQFSGPSAIRLRHGCVRQRKWGAEFLELPFEDHARMKWLCLRCGWENYIISEDSGCFACKLENITADGQCCLCKQVIQPYPLEDWSSAIMIELGEMTPSSKGPFSIFRPRQVGHLHYFCADDVGIEFWRLIDRSDVPDYRGYLSCG